jgi:predicted transcriptional regulator
MTEEISDAEESKTGQIFTELAGKVRRAMLFRLNEKSLKLSELAKDLNITIQHAHSNINRLTDIGLVEKDSNGSISLTTYGRTIIKQIPSFNFLGEHKEYFQDHTLGNIPLKFERRIGDLNECKVVKGVVAVLQGWKLMYQRAGEYINSIIPQVPVDLIEPLAEKIKGGTKFSYILPEDAIVPKGMSEATKKVSWNTLLTEGKAERRMVKKIQAATVITDKSACVLFPNLKNEIDMNAMFYSEDKVFHEWCQDYFRYVWYASDLFDRRKVQSET